VQVSPERDPRGGNPPRGDRAAARACRAGKGGGIDARYPRARLINRDVMPRRALPTICLTALVHSYSLLLCAGSLSAQDYPTRPILFIVRFPPGGGTDLVSRVLAQRIAEQTKWSFAIENKPGAGGSIGVELAARAAADGYTVVMGQTSNLALNPALNPKLPY